MKLFLLASILLFIIPFSGFSQIALEKRSFLDNRVELLIPKDFSIMTTKMMDKKYPNRSPQTSVILTDENGEVNIVIMFLNQHIQASQVGEFKDFQIATLKKVRPDAKWLEDGVKTINGKSVGCFKFVSAAVDQNVFNYYFFTDMDGKVLLFTFNCTEKLLPKWKETAETIVSSLKVK